MRKIALASILAIFAASAASAALLPDGGVVGTTTFNSRVGDTANLANATNAAVALTTNLTDAVLAIDAALADLDLTGVEYQSNKTQDIAASILGGDGATDYPSARAVEDYVEAQGFVDETDLDGKQDKASGVTAGYVATWGAAGTGGLSSTAGQRAITETAAGIVTGNTGLATGGAVADYIAQNLPASYTAGTGISISEENVISSTVVMPTPPEECFEGGVNNCVLSHNGTAWVWLKLY